MSNIHINKTDIIKGLKELGLRKGDMVMFHSSLKSMGYVERGADTVLDAFLEVLGERGTIMLPVFTGSNSSDKPFDFYNSPSEVGKVTETLRLRKGTLRSFYPTHSFTAFGKMAYELVKDHQKSASPFDKYSPIDKFINLGGLIILLGVDFVSCTAIHVGETRVNLPLQDSTGYVLNGSEVSSWSIKSRPGASHGFYKIEPVLREKNLIKETKIGNAKVILLDGKELVDTVVEMLKADMTSLLCDDPNCPKNIFVRQKIKKQDGI